MREFSAKSRHPHGGTPMVPGTPPRTERGPKPPCLWKALLCLGIAFAPLLVQGREQRTTADGGGTLMVPVARIPVNASLPLGDPNDVTERGGDDVTPRHEFRLPDDLKPVEYFIRVHPVPVESDAFSGSVEVDLVVQRPTDVIHLNVGDIKIDTESVKVTSEGPSGRRTLRVVDHALFPQTQVATFTLSENLLQGCGVRISMSYSGVLVDDSRGLNRFFYTDEAGRKRRILTTYLQPTGARSVFPCMDEPNLKARFSLRVGALKGERVISNMKVRNSSLGETGKTHWTEFDRSLPMSPYLVAFVVSGLHARSTRDNKIRVWARKSKVGQVSYALHLAPKVLKWCERVLGVPYPMPKLDLVTFPSYAVSGMENFGLITTKEDSLTTNGKLSRKEWVATVTAHEIAHMWAGNLVTPIWWSKYWLSEGFATFLAATSLDELEPSLEATNHMLLKEAQLTLRQDEGERNNPLVWDDFNPLIKPPKNIFMYFKGAAMLNMLKSIWGEESFKIGLARYFEKYQFKTVDESDLYSTLMDVWNDRTNFSQTLPTDLALIMETWTTQMGYPLVTVRRNAEGGVTVQQEQFKEVLHDLTNGTGSWWIPLSYATSRNPCFNLSCPRVWMPPSDAPMTIEDVTRGDSWVIPNVKWSAYLRVNYDPGMWAAITEQLVRDHTVIHMANRARLLDDAFHLFYKGHIGIDAPLGLLSYLGGERSFFPLYSAFLQLYEMEVVLRGHPRLYPLFRSYALSFLSPLMGIPEGGAHMERKRRHLVLKWACKFQHPDCSRISREKFQLWRESSNLASFPETTVGSLLCVLLEEEGTGAEWELVFRSFLSGVTPELKKEFAEALACSANQTTIIRYMTNVTTQAGDLTEDDLRDIFTSLIRSRRWGQVTWNFLLSNAAELKRRFADGIPVPFVTTQYDYDQMKQYLALLYPEKLQARDENAVAYLAESQKYAEKSSRIISEAGKWLTRNKKMVIEAAR